MTTIQESEEAYRKRRLAAAAAKRGAGGGGDGQGQGRAARRAGRHGAKRAKPGDNRHSPRHCGRANRATTGTVAGVRGRAAMNAHHDGGCGLG